MSLLGLDIGTTGCKAAAFTPEGKLLSQAYNEYPLIHPREGWNELDVLTVWESVSRVLRQVNREIAADPASALSVSCQGEAVVPVDRTGTHLYNFIVTFDSRTEPYIPEWEKRPGRKQLFSKTGMPLHPMYSISKIRWFMDHRPGLFEKTWKFLCVEDYINFRLTGNPVIDYSLASRTMAFNIHEAEWDGKILALAGIDAGILSTVQPSGTIVGTIRDGTAAELGFSREVTVAAGGHDQPCGALGAGVDQAGSALFAMGTSEVICPVSPLPILSGFMLKNNYSCYNHVAAGSYITLAVNLTGGLLLRWYRDTLCDREKELAEKEERSPYEVIIREASEEIKSIYFLPHFVGAGTPCFDPYSRGALAGLTNETTKGDITRALLNSIIFESKTDLNLLKQGGFTINDLRAVGGGSRSDRWLQMKADCLGLPVNRMKIQEAAALGAAILAGTATGVYRTCREGIESCVKTEKEFLPRKDREILYNEKYGEFIQLYPALKTFNHTITKKTSHKRSKQ